MTQKPRYARSRAMLVCRSRSGDPCLEKRKRTAEAGARFQCHRDAKRTDIFRSLDRMEADVSMNAVARNVGVGPGAHCASGDFMLEHTSLFAPAKTAVDLFGIRDGWTPSYRVAVQENAMRVRAPPVAPSSKRVRFPPGRPLRRRKAGQGTRGGLGSRPHPRICHHGVARRRGMKGQ